MCGCVRRLTAGIVLLVIAGLLTIVGLIFIILLCTGVIGQRNQTAPAVCTTALLLLFVVSK